MPKAGNRLTFDARSSMPITDCRCTPREQFFLEELERHRRCLDRQREFYSEHAIEQVESALARVISRLEDLTQQPDAEQVVGHVLRQLDVVTRLSAWDEPRHLH